MYFETAQQVFICYSFVAFLKDYIVLTPCLQVSDFFKIVEGGRSMFSCKNDDDSCKGRLSIERAYHCFSLMIYGFFTLFTQLSKSFIQRLIFRLFKIHVMLIFYLLNMGK